MKNVLIISKSDSNRSQMVKGYLQYFARKRAKVYSAGLKPGKLDPLAIQAMEEIGLDISDHTCNELNAFEHINFDYIVTVCDEAKAQLPYLFSGALNVHQHLEDLSDYKGSKEEKLEEYRRVSDDARVLAHKFSKVHFKGVR